jgi:hypothetical protein
VGVNLVEGSESLWIAPLLLLPGVGLLVLSTSTRFGQLHDEFHRTEHGSSRWTRQCLLRRARLFRAALACLYVSIASLAIASVLGTVLHQGAAFLIARSLTIFAVLLVAIAAGLLIREATILLSVFGGELGKTDES